MRNRSRPQVDQQQPGAPPNPEAIACDRLYHGLIQRILLRKGVWRQDLEDVHQDVIIAVIGCLPTVGPVGSMNALIATIALRHAVSYLRTRGRRPIEGYDENTTAAPPSSQQPIRRPDREYTLKKEREALDAALEQMDSELVDVFILIELEEMTKPEVAKAFDVSETTVQSRLRRARQQFEDLCGPVRDVSERGAGR